MNTLSFGGLPPLFWLILLILFIVFGARGFREHSVRRQLSLSGEQTLLSPL